MSRGLTLSLVVAGLLVAGGVWLFWSGGDRPEDKPGLAGEDRAIFVQAATEACTTAQSGAPDNASLSPAKIAAFCGCYGNSLADAMSPADIARLSKLSKAEIVAAQEDRADAAFQSCSGSIDDGKP